GQSALANLKSAGLSFEVRALAAGLLFNVANLLLVAAIDATGLAIAFPVGIGLALIIGTVVSYWQTPRGDPRLLALGIACIRGAPLAGRAWPPIRCGGTYPPRNLLCHSGRCANGLLLPAAFELHITGLQHKAHNARCAHTLWRTRSIRYRGACERSTADDCLS